MTELQSTIERLFDLPAKSLPADANEAFVMFRDQLTAGTVRAAEPTEDGWKVNGWVKKGILLGFRLGTIETFDAGASFSFQDKSTYPPRRFQLEDGVRVVPGGSTVRSGAYIGRGVVCMPPMYVNVGAYVGAETMIDSHALVGSCAQVGERVHVSAGVQIGGVLEPVGARPVIVEDDVLVGGNCGIYEGTRVGREAVLAPGTILTRATPVYDLVHEAVIRGSVDEPLTIPAGAVVVPGSRPARGEYARENGLHLYAPMIVKYRDPGTNASVELEGALRP